MLGPLLFLLYKKDLQTSSNLVVPKTFAEDTNLFFDYSNINTLFKTVNDNWIRSTNGFLGVLLEGTHKIRLK